ncbi:hypothetical protein Q8A73_012659 [Channa argus]|nr:hypothetical protein Q8A73_012659 [Channa argus]
MAANSSSSSLNYFQHCSDVKVGDAISVSFVVAHVLFLVPVSILILYLGHRRWRQQRSFATTSHSDIFTYHSAVMELIFAVGHILYFCGEYFGLLGLMKVGFWGTATFYPAHTYFHILTCVERYLAVVHPVLYLRHLRQSGGVRIRNISTGCVWLLYCGWIGVEALHFPLLPYIPIFCLLVSSLVVMSFCSLSVLCVLLRRGPGQTSGNREQVDKTKQRAFQTITAITGVLWLFFLGVLVCNVLDNSHLLSYSDGCVVMLSGSWFSLPSSLVLPLLFLLREGKPLCCHCRKT